MGLIFCGWWGQSQIMNLKCSLYCNAGVKFCEPPQYTSIGSFKKKKIFNQYFTFQKKMVVKKSFEAALIPWHYYLKEEPSSMPKNPRKKLLNPKNFFKNISMIPLKKIRQPRLHMESSLLVGRALRGFLFGHWLFRLIPPNLNPRYFFTKPSTKKYKDD